MSNNLTTENLFEYLLLKQRIIDQMKESKAPCQEFELDGLEVGDSIINSAIMHAKSVIVKINAVNKGAYEAGLESSEAKT